MADLKTIDLSPEDFVRMLLWDDFPECCGNPVEDTGGEYMGQRETVMSCCGCPEPARLADAQIVASLRERFPEQPECPTCGGNGYTNEGDPEIGNALFDCTTCSGSGRLPAGAVSTLSAVAVAPAVSPAHGELPRHQFWGAGEPDCPPELKARNGELHTTRCKVCGDGWRKSLNVCLAARQGMPIERIAMLWNSLPLETDPQSVIAFARAIERFHGIAAHGVGVPAPALREVAEMVALDDGLGTVFLEFHKGCRPPAGTKLYVLAPGVAIPQGGERGNLA